MAGRPDASPNASSGPSACPPGNAPPGRPRASRRALLRSARRGPSARPGAPCRIVVRYAREMAAMSSCLRCCRAAPHRPAADPRASPPEPALPKAGGNDDLHTIRPVIARVPEAALVAFRKRRIRFEVCARQIIKQHVVADVEQVAPPSHQVIEDRLLVPQQSVMTAIQLVDLGEPRILA